MMLRITVGFKVKVECGELGNALNSCILEKRVGGRVQLLPPAAVWLAVVVFKTLARH